MTFRVHFKIQFWSSFGNAIDREKITQRIFWLKDMQKSMPFWFELFLFWIGFQIINWIKHWRFWNNNYSFSSWQLLSWHFTWDFCPNNLLQICIVFPFMKSCFMLHQCMLCWECFFTCIALKRSLSIMNTNNMDCECCLSFELFFTVIILQ